MGYLIVTFYYSLFLHAMFKGLGGSENSPVEILLKVTLSAASE